jgi:hypothetical protein
VNVADLSKWFGTMMIDKDNDVIVLQSCERMSQETVSTRKDEVAIIINAIEQ